MEGGGERGRGGEVWHAPVVLKIPTRGSHDSVYDARSVLDSFRFFPDIGLHGIKSVSTEQEEV